MSVEGNPGSKGSTPSMRAIWARESDSVSASMFARRCATLRPPTIGNTCGVFCSRYAIATTRTHARTHTNTERERASLHDQHVLRPTWGARHVPAWMLCAPSSCATASSAALIARSSAERSHCGPKIVRPFSPVSRLCASSASVRSLPLASTSHGASARPACGADAEVRGQRRADGRRTGARARIHVPSLRAMGMISRSKER